MLEFMSNEVFQIIVIIAFVFISLEIYYFCKYSLNTQPSSSSQKSDISNDKIYEIVDDIDYRLDRINTKVNELMNMFMNGLIVNDGDKETSEEKNEEIPEKTSGVHQNLEKDENNVEVHNENNIIFDENESLNDKESIEQRIIDSIKNHMNELNYDDLEISDLPKTEELQGDIDVIGNNVVGDDSVVDVAGVSGVGGVGGVAGVGGVSLNENTEINTVIYEPIHVEPTKKLKIAKRIL